jgi:hypothetical protein
MCAEPGFWALGAGWRGALRAEQKPCGSSGTLALQPKRGAQTHNRNPTIYITPTLRFLPAPVRPEICELTGMGQSRRVGGIEGGAAGWLARVVRPAACQVEGTERLGR